ncbi:BCCT family transporter [Sediminibacillus dalangtanensis]|uniref:BCCT family transporter n=1 Tax=Sediminibacillus dalangtanensis TaxID=2729421 RepID=A0ABX7VQ00_9BACI|nr:BCCT family transporter [Sediminibacillus dalangtanensis]QTM98939.1 BCCT family transporter [Sediminibacillus dalangtanensis]
MDRAKKKAPGAVFSVSFCIIVLFVAWGVVFPEQLSQASTAGLHWMRNYFSWFYMLATTIFVLTCLYLAIGPYRHLKLGKPDSKPTYSFFTWLGLLFAAGMGVGLVFWGVAEPVLHYVEPPPGYEAETNEAAKAALTYSVFHWALQPWGVFAIIVLSMAFFKFRRNRPGLISHAFYPLLGERTDGVVGKVINIFATLATAIGVATTFGLSAMQVSGGISEVFGTPNSKVTQLIIIAVVTGLFITSAVSGVNKGMRYLSSSNIIIAGVLMVFVLVLGPTAFLLESFTTAVGQYIGQYIPMSLSLSPYSDGSWRGQWTIFFWAWVIAWGPYVGTFIARISRGRTIREFVFGVLFVPALLGAIWFSIMGGTGLHMQISEGIDIASRAQQHEEVAFFMMLGNLPLGLVLNILGILLITIFFITSADSASYVLSVLSSKGTLNPKTLTKLSWGFLISITAAVLLLSGGLEALRAVAIMTAMPFTVIILVMIVSLIKGLREEFGKHPTN